VYAGARTDGVFIPTVKDRVAASISVMDKIFLGEAAAGYGGRDPHHDRIGRSWGARAGEEKPEVGSTGGGGGGSMAVASAKPASRDPGGSLSA
jgi:hypothetical protein